MQDLLAGRSAIVTGGARGIGLAVAQTLGLLGAKVLIVDNGAALDGGPEDPAVTELAAMRVPGAIGLAIDVAGDDAAEQAVTMAVETFGAIDLLVNNAAIELDARIGDGRREDFERVLRTNLVAPWALATSVVGPMRRQARAGRRPGAIVNVGSAVGLLGRGGRAAEAASKAGLIGMTKSIAKELGSRNILANVVAPGFIETDMTAAMTPEARQALSAGIPLERLGTPEDVAGMVAVLASDLAGYVTGQVFVVDGGMVM